MEKKNGLYGTERYLRLRNGAVEADSAVGMPDGVIFLPLEKTDTEHKALIAGTFGEDDYSGAGVFLFVPSGTDAGRFVVEYAYDGEGAFASSDVIIVGDGASAEVVYVIGGDSRGKYAANHKRYTYIGGGGKLSVGELAVVSEPASVSLDSRVSLGAQARSETVTTALGSATVSINSQTALDGSDAECNHHGLYMLAGEEKADVDITVRHNVPDCRSSVLFKGIASGTSRGSFNGLVYVAQDAQHTEAYQQSRNLLLSDTARILTSPQLEIYADDVKCSHGATVGQMDENAIYYMRQRGLSEKEARGLQMTGFINEILDRLPGEELVEKACALAEEKINRL